MIAKDPQLGRGWLKKQLLMRARRLNTEDTDASLCTVLPLETSTYLMSDIEDWDIDEHLGR